MKRPSNIPDITITIHPSPTADTRTCDFSKVSKETLLESSKQHVADIAKGFEFFKAMIDKQAAIHDHDKFSDINGFHRDFITGFKQHEWWDNHRQVNRHHLTDSDGIPEDVNLIDILDFIVDCTMAGKARSGKVRPLEIPTELLQKAFENTANLLIERVTVTEGTTSI